MAKGKEKLSPVGRSSHLSVRVRVGIRVGVRVGVRAGVRVRVRVRVRARARVRVRVMVRVRGGMIARERVPEAKELQHGEHEHEDLDEGPPGEVQGRCRGDVGEM